MEHEPRLTVHIRTGESEPNTELATNGPAIPSAPIEEIDVEHRPVPQQQPVTVHSPALPLVTRPAEDWQTSAEQSARASVDEQIRDEQTRSSMWHQSYSVAQLTM